MDNYKMEASRLKAADAEIRHKRLLKRSQIQEDLDSVSVAMGELELKTREIEYLHARESMRPYMLQNAMITWDQTEGKFRCQTFAGDGDIPVVAYGKSPSEACDNFDYVWING